MNTLRKPSWILPFLVLLVKVVHGDHSWVTSFLQSSPLPVRRKVQTRLKALNNAQICSLHPGPKWCRNLSIHVASSRFSVKCPKLSSARY
jgi:hypothetical protein